MLAEAAKLGMVLQPLQTLLGRELRVARRMSFFEARRQCMLVSRVLPKLGKPRGCARRQRLGRRRGHDAKPERLLFVPWERQAST